jgi:hypothetical protein
MPDPDDLTSGDGDGQQQSQDDDDAPNPLKTVDQAELFLYSKTGRKDFDGEDLLELLRKPEIRKGSEGYADSLVAKIEAEDRQAQEAAAAVHAKRQAEEFESALEKKKSEVRREREELAAKNADASLRAEAIRALEAEDGGDDSVVAVNTEVERLRGQYDALDPHSKKADDILEEMTKLLDTIPAGRVGGKLDVDVDAFEREMGEVFR